MANKPQCTNRLAQERSPYLLQHSTNPVDWRPWGDEAFAAARRLDRPVFVSIGYSACHWCHVMAEESFSDPAIASLLNNDFICVKVDREEHPDLDNFFIKAVTAITGSAGWPLNVFLTPDKLPFYGGTYFPPRGQRGVPGFTTVIESVKNAWKDNRREIMDSARKISELITTNVRFPTPKAPVDDSVLHKGYEFLSNNYDPLYGGFGTSPKFPISYYIRFLLRYYKRFRQPHSLEMAEHTLDRMQRGGVYDQLGGGFHRYSTDERWHLPHFEKMLYDQALMSRAYMEAYQVTGNFSFAVTGKGIVDFVLAQMTWYEGGFFASLDADSQTPHNPGKIAEGAFYLWPKAEIDEVLGPDSALFCHCYGVREDGNIPDTNGEFRGLNVLYQAHTAAEAAREFKLSLKKAQAKVCGGLKRLLAGRETRPWPRIDDKILADWNSLMISSLCLAHRLFPGRGYAAQAQQAARLLLEKMRDDKGMVMHCFRDWEASIPGMLEDHAFLAEALLDLYEITFSLRYLNEALRTAGIMVSLFHDARKKGFYINSPEFTDVRYLQKEMYDAAIPSGVGEALSVMLRLSSLTGERKWKDLAMETVQSISGDIAAAPYSYINLLVPMFLYFGPVKQVVIAAKNASQADKFIKSMAQRFLPTTVSALRPWTRGQLDRASEVIPHLKERTPVAGKATAYVCSDGTCYEPVTSPDDLFARLEK